MSTVIITLPDDILEAVRIEAEYFGTTAEQRIERMIESGDLKTLRDYLPDYLFDVPEPAFVDESREAIYDDPSLYPVPQERL